MLRHDTSRGRGHAMTIAPTVESPTGNVRLLASDPQPEVQRVQRTGGEPSGPTPGWTIYDGQGRPQLPAHPNRAAALRELGVLAFHGACLPLTVFDPQGRATGDRLA